MTPCDWLALIVFYSPRIPESTMRIRYLLLTSLLALSTVRADSPWPNPVGRKSDSRQGDLIAALIDRQMLDEAKEICLHHQRKADPRSDDAAAWAIRLSQIETARLMTGDQFDAPAIKRAQQPVDALLTSYPDHQRKLFLIRQQLAVAHDAAQACSRGGIDQSDQCRSERSNLCFPGQGDNKVA